MISISPHFDCIAYSYNAVHEQYKKQTRMPEDKFIGGKQQVRLVYLEYRLYFFGELKRSDIIDRFNVAPACATRDIAAYRQLVPENIFLDSSDKTYKISAGFKPYFQHSPEGVLSSLASGFGDFVEVPCKAVNAISPGCLQTLDVNVLAVISRSIYSGKIVRLEYLSRSSGKSYREVAPHVLVSSGFRWHIRAFDRNRKAFRDFVLSRIISATMLDENSAPHEHKDCDMEWNRLVDLRLVPHPASAYREIIEQDYRMNNGSLNLRVRSAVAGYFLRYWNVDCSVGHKLDSLQYELHLSNPISLYDVSSALMAPGYHTTMPL